MATPRYSKVRITTAKNDVHEFEGNEQDEAIQTYAILSARGETPRMTLLDSAGQEIPAMEANPDWEVS